jgi:hypothetical protein
MKIISKHNSKIFNIKNNHKYIPKLSDKQILYLIKQYFLLINKQNFTNQRYKIINLK